MLILLHHLVFFNYFISIVPTPASRAAGPMGYYLAGTLDGTRPGKFYANVHNLANW